MGNRYLFESGKIFIGTDEETGTPIGIETPRHALTFAGARSGKGAACIIPNLKVWTNNALVIDPKGEAAENSCEDRENLGQSVFVVDPFEFAKIDNRFRAAYNPLDDIDIDSIMVQEQINAVTDGIIMRHDPRHAMWDDNAQGILSGLIAFVKLAEDPENQNILRVREILRTEEIHAAAEVMKESSECGGMLQTAAGIIEAEQGSQFIANARENTKWIDSLPMRNSLANPNLRTFSLSQLKSQETTIYLVLPPNYLSQHGRFLRMFVRCALEAMGQKLPSGELLAKRCLFILDEFYSLGRIEEIAKASGLMPGMGVHLWPFLQDLGQLTTLYGQDGAQTFFGNADLVQFFGNTDPNTLEFMSKLTGVTAADEIGLPPAAPVTTQGQSIVGSMMQSSQNSKTRIMGAGFGALSGSLQAWGAAASQAEYQDQMNAYQQRMAKVGTPRVTPEEMAQLVQRRDDVVADKMFCVLNGNDKFFVKPLPYFRTSGNILEQDNQSEESPWNKPEEVSWGVCFFNGFILCFILWAAYGWLSGGIETHGIVDFLISAGMLSAIFAIPLALIFRKFKIDLQL